LDRIQYTLPVLDLEDALTSRRDHSDINFPQHDTELADNPT